MFLVTTSIRPLSSLLQHNQQAPANWRKATKQKLLRKLVLFVFLLSKVVKNLFAQEDRVDIFPRIVQPLLKQQTNSKTETRMNEVV